MDNQNTEAICQYCKGKVSVLDMYCPICGKKLKGEVTSSATLSKQLWIYFVSFFLPPFGFWPAVKYLRQSDEKSKKIGWVALILTTISVVVTILLSISIFKSFTSELGGQFELYEGFGL